MHPFPLRLRRTFKNLAVAAGCALALLLPAGAGALAPSGSSLDARLAGLSSEELEDLFVFVAGNALFTAYHEAGHMLISELQLPVLAQEEDAVDNLATLLMLSADNDDMDLFLTNAMIGWFLVASLEYSDLVFYGEHALDAQRGYRILCLMAGADPDAFSALAIELDLPKDRVESCAYDYDQTAGSWEAVTDPYVRETGSPAGMTTVSHEAAPEGLESVALFLREAEILEQVAEELDTFYQLPEPVTFRAAACGTENAFWDPGTREVILCHELLGAFAELYLTELR